jgi:hypothetical protein
VESADGVIREKAHALIALGMSRKDSAVAAHLAVLIRDLDALVFPMRPADVRCLAKAHSKGFIAGYDDESLPQERYIVYAEGIYRQFKEDALALGVSLLARITAVAVHEVRHRLQFWLKEHLDMWTPRMHRAGPLGASINRAREEQLMRILQARVQGRRAMQGHLKEFDALVVEYYALWRLEGVEALDDLVPFVWLEP